MQITGKQLTTIIVSVCAAAILSPVAVGAATGTLTNIIDPAIGSRQARVTAAGALNTEQRAGGLNGAFNVQYARLGLGWIPLVNSTNAQRIAITELTISGEGPTGPQTVLIEAWTRKGNTGSCNSVNLTDFDRHTLPRIEVDNYKTVFLNFSGPPLYPPVAGAAGVYTCFGVNVVSIPSGSATYAGATGYKFTP